MKVFFKNQIYFLILLIPFNSFALADEDSIENLLDDMKNEVAELENEYYFLKNNILSPTNDANTNYGKFLDSLRMVSVQLKNERIEIFAKIVDLEIDQKNIIVLSKLNSKAIALNNIITHFHNIYQNYHPFIKSKSYSFETYDYNIKGLNDLENFLDKL